MGSPDEATAPVTPVAATPVTTPAVETTPTAHQPLRREVFGMILGEKYRDSVMGIEGVATTYVVHLTGCNRVGIEWLNKEGNIRSEFVDENRLIHVESEKPVVPETDKPGHCGDPPHRGLR